MPFPPMSYPPHRHRHEHSHGHYHNHDNCPPNHNHHHHHPPVLAPSVPHTHYFHPVPQPPAYKPFTFPLIFENPPESTPTIGKSFPSSSLLPEVKCPLSPFPNYHKQRQTRAIQDDTIINARIPPSISRAFVR
jgi:hypothetical protein